MGEIVGVLLTWQVLVMVWLPLILAGAYLVAEGRILRLEDTDGA